MHLLWDEDEWETVFDHRPCSCGGKCNGCCNGYAGISQRRRTPEAVAAIKAERLRNHEEAVLAEAEIIKMRRRVAVA